MIKMIKKITGNDRGDTHDVDCHVVGHSDNLSEDKSDFDNHVM